MFYRPPFITNNVGKLIDFTIITPDLFEKARDQIDAALIATI